jgi:molecular chaperone GrpE
MSSVDSLSFTSTSTSSKATDVDSDNLANEEVEVEVKDSESTDDIGTLSYEELLDKKEELEKSILRANADLDNALKRTLSEVEKAHKYGVEKLLVELLPVIDSLEHALNNLSSGAPEEKEGIELTLKSFESALDKFGMIPIYPVNEEFNPEKHEAVTMEQDKDKENGAIGNVFQRGWELHTRVVRPARVTVIKN